LAFVDNDLGTIWRVCANVNIAYLIHFVKRFTSAQFTTRMVILFPTVPIVQL